MYINQKKNCLILLSNGKSFKANSILKKKNLFLETVFNTSNTGYQEVITDPSYCNQTVIFTNSHFGNTGLNQQDSESNRIWLSCIITKDYFFNNNTNFRCETNLFKFLKKEKLVVLEKVDTRNLVKFVRLLKNKYSIIIHNKIKKIKFLCKNFKYLKYVSYYNFFSENYNYSNFFLKKNNFFLKKIFIINLGLKNNILRNLSKRSLFLIVSNYKFKISYIKKINPDGILISNGPGDPRIYPNLVKKISKITNLFPLLGICMGHQIICISKNSKIKKMQFGQHGINHPVKYNNNFYISSQNHNYCSVIKNKIYSLFDETNQGLFEKNIISFQGHPESCPGPLDFEFIFDLFFNKL
ncbi:glutamine-hydrolyzing carbamoyl-phosphate synthase small subunit [Candidatus Vidania fulgoroideorum]